MISIRIGGMPKRTIFLGFKNNERLNSGTSNPNEKRCLEDNDFFGLVKYRSKKNVQKEHIDRREKRDNLENTKAKILVGIDRWHTKTKGFRRLLEWATSAHLQTKCYLFFPMLSPMHKTYLQEKSLSFIACAPIAGDRYFFLGFACNGISGLTPIHTFSFPELWEKLMTQQVTLGCLIINNNTTTNNKTMIILLFL